MNPNEFAVGFPEIDGLARQLAPLDSETVSLEQALGRTLADDYTLDRDSPACNVSAMDGYALRLSDWCEDGLPVQTTIAAGQPTQPLLPRHCVQIFTGGSVPDEADCVVKREDVVEQPNRILPRSKSQVLSPRSNIRFQAENAAAGQIIATRGQIITPARIAQLASCGHASVRVVQKIRIAILNTGNELRSAHETVQSWQIRDSNGPLLQSLVQQHANCEILVRQHVADRLSDTVLAIGKQFSNVDLILLTGGVSMGNTDYVPQAVESAGGSIAFHRLPIRPGKPILGGIGPNGECIFGLPGNPISVATTARRFVIPVLDLLSQRSHHTNAPIAVRISNADEKTLPLVWFRLARITSYPEAELIATMGSGDVISLGQSDGFVEVPMNSAVGMRRDFYSWQIH